MVNGTRAVLYIIGCAKTGGIKGGIGKIGRRSRHGSFCEEGDTKCMEKMDALLGWFFGVLFGIIVIFGCFFLLFCVYKNHKKSKVIDSQMTLTHSCSSD